jgi:O-antigen chain-terminating methyltransferase
MVEACRARGLEADRVDAVAFLESRPDASLGGLIAIQVVEHLEPAYLMRLIEAASHALRPGGVMVLETINPGCWVAFFESYIRDLTHVRPLHPDTLRYLMQTSGFSQVDVQYRAPVPEVDRLQRVQLPALAAGQEHDAALVDLVDAVNAHADKLNARLFTFMDYAIVARR